MDPSSPIVISSDSDTDSDPPPPYDSIVQRSDDDVSAPDSASSNNKTGRGEPSKTSSAREFPEGRNPAGEEDDNSNELFAEAARKIAVAACEAYGFVGDQQPDRTGGLTQEFDGKVPPELGQEQELELLVRPELLRGGDWVAPLPQYTTATCCADKACVNANLNALNVKMDRIMSILHLHSVAFIGNIKAANETRLLCLAERGQKDEVYRRLQSSLRAVVLGADPDLKAVPFTSLPNMATFFGRRARVEKLAFILLSYFDVGESYAKSIISFTLSGDLQREVTWSGPNGR